VFCLQARRDRNDVAHDRSKAWYSMRAVKRLWAIWANICALARG
jgi:hypothetical protein